MTLKAITANRLADGRVVFLAPDGVWRDSVDEARLEEDEAGWAALEEAGRAAEAAPHVVEPYLIEAERTADGGVRPTRYRERIRAQGPSVHPDLGKQGEPAERRTPANDGPANDGKVA